MKQHAEYDPRMKKLCVRMENKAEMRNDPNNFDMKIVNKSRVVDPLCWHGHALVRLSDVENDWAKVVEEERKPKEYYIKFLD